MLNILKKELKDSFRDKRTLLLTVFLPIALMSGLVFFYENLLSPHDDESYKVVVEKEQEDVLKGILADYKNLDVTTVKDVEKQLEEGKADVGINIPSDFEQQVTSGAIPKVQILGDENSQNSYIAMTTVQQAFEQYRETIIGQQLTNQNVDVSVLKPFEVEQVQIVEGNDSLVMISFLISLMLTIGIGAGITPTVTDLITGEKERRTMEALLMTPISRSSLLFAKWLTSVIIATMIGVITIIIVFVEINFFTVTLKEGLFLDGNMIVIVLSVLLAVISYAMLMTSVLILVSIISKTVKEAQSYCMPISMVAILPSMYIVNLGLNELTMMHFSIPIMNFFALTKELFYGVVDVQHILLNIGGNVLGAIVIFFIGRIMFMKDKWVLA